MSAKKKLSRRKVAQRCNAKWEKNPISLQIVVNLSEGDTIALNSPEKIAQHRLSVANVMKNALTNAEHRDLKKSNRTDRAKEIFAKMAIKDKWTIAKCRKEIRKWIREECERQKQQRNHIPFLNLLPLDEEYNNKLPLRINVTSVSDTDRATILTLDGLKEHQLSLEKQIRAFFEKQKNKELCDEVRAEDAYLAFREMAVLQRWTPAKAQYEMEKWMGEADERRAADRKDIERDFENYRLALYPGTEKISRKRKGSVEAVQNDEDNGNSDNGNGHGNVKNKERNAEKKIEDVGNEEKTVGNETKVVKNGDKKIVIGGEVIRNKDKKIGDGDESVANVDEDVRKVDKIVSTEGEIIGNESKIVGVGTEIVGYENKKIEDETEIVKNKERKVGGETEVVENEDTDVGAEIGIVGNENGSRRTFQEDVERKDNDVGYGNANLEREDIEDEYEELDDDDEYVEDEEESSEDDDAI